MTVQTNNSIVRQLYTPGLTANLQVMNPDAAARQQLFAQIRAEAEQTNRPPSMALAAALLGAAMTEFTNLCIRNARQGFSGVTELSQAGNFPAQPGRVVQVYFEGSEEPADTTWTQLTGIDDFRGTNEDSFTLQNVSNGITFRSYKNGENVELYAISGSEVKVPFELFGGGFQWLQTWLDDNKWWTIPNGLAEAATQYAKEMAINFYQVLTAAGYTTAPRVTTPADQPLAYYDIQTINTAYTATLARLRADSGYGAPNPRMYLVYNNADAQLATRVPGLATGFATATGGPVALNGNVTLLGTPNVPAGGYWLVLPSRKTRTGVRMDMTGFEYFDVFSYSGARVFWGRYTHARGDNNQVTFIPLS